MSDRSKLKEELKKKSKEAAERTDALLEEELAALLKASRTDLEALRPQVTDKEVYDKLIAAVGEATQRNESVAEFRERLKKIGKGASEVVKRVSGLITGR